MTGKTVRLSICQSLEREVEFVRRKAFLGENSTVSMHDEFDEHSSHLVLTLDDRPVASMRITHPPARVFNTWTRGKAGLPDNSKSADVGRLCVLPNLSGLALSKILLPKCLIEAEKIGYQMACGATSDSRMLKSCVELYKAKIIGSEVPSYEPNCPPLSVTPIVFDLVRNKQAMQELFVQRVSYLKENQINFIESSK